MVLSIGERLKGFLFSPSETFDNSKDDTIGDAFKYFVVILMIYALIISVLVAVAFSWFASMLGMLGIPMMALGIKSYLLCHFGIRSETTPSWLYPLLNLIRNCPLYPLNLL